MPNSQARTKVLVRVQSRFSTCYSSPYLICSYRKTQFLSKLFGSEFLLYSFDSLFFPCKIVLSLSSLFTSMTMLFVALLVIGFHKVVCSRMTMRRARITTFLLICLSGSLYFPSATTINESFLYIRSGEYYSYRQQVIGYPAYAVFQIS